MRGVPDEVTWDDDKILVKFGTLRMPLPKSECERLFGREPRNAHDAMTWGMRLKRRKVPISLSNIRCKGQDDPPTRRDELARRKRRRANQVRVEMNDVVMAKGEGTDERPYPTWKEVAAAAHNHDSTLVDYEPPNDDDSKSKLKLKFNIGGKSAKLDSAEKQKGVVKTLEAIQSELGIASFKLSFSDQ